MSSTKTALCSRKGIEPVPGGALDCGEVERLGRTGIRQFRPRGGHQTAPSGDETT